MLLIDILLFSRDKIHKLSQSAMKTTLLEIIELSPEKILEDVINYWCCKNYEHLTHKHKKDKGVSAFNFGKDVHCRNYEKIIKEITPKTTDIKEFHKEISDRLKKLI